MQLHSNSTSMVSSLYPSIFIITYTLTPLSISPSSLSTSHNLIYITFTISFTVASPASKARPIRLLFLIPSPGIHHDVLIVLFKKLKLTPRGLCRHTMITARIRVLHFIPYWFYPYIVRTGFQPIEVHYNSFS